MPVMPDHVRRERERESELRARVAPHVAQYERGILTVADLLDKLYDAVVGQ